MNLKNWGGFSPLAPPLVYTLVCSNLHLYIFDLIHISYYCTVPPLLLYMFDLIHIMNDVLFHPSSAHGPRLQSQGEGDKQLTLCRRRERDREQRVSESAEERELCCSLWRQRDRETDVRHILHSRERVVYSRSDSM